MLEFYRQRAVVGRKQYVCSQCGQPIPLGERHYAIALKADGDFASYREHVECRAAWVDLRGLRDLGWHEDSPALMDDGEIPVDDRAWIIAEHPTVAARLGLVPIPTETEAA